MCSCFVPPPHSVISNVSETVSVTPMENAKTFVNGTLISELTVLHHVRIGNPVGQK